MWTVVFDAAGGNAVDEARSCGPNKRVAKRIFLTQTTIELQLPLGFHLPPSMRPSLAGNFDLPSLRSITGWLSAIDDQRRRAAPSIHYHVQGVSLQLRACGDSVIFQTNVQRRVTTDKSTTGITAEDISFCWDNSKGLLLHRGSKLDLRLYLRSTQKTVAPFEFRAGLEIEIKLVSNHRNWRFEISIRDQQPPSTNIKLDSGLKLGSFDLGSEAMLVKPALRRFANHLLTDPLAARGAGGRVWGAQVCNLFPTCCLVHLNLPDECLPLLSFLGPTLVLAQHGPAGGCPKDNAPCGEGRRTVVCLEFIIVCSRCSPWSASGRAVSLLASDQGEPGLIPGRLTPGFSHVGIVADDAAGRRVFLGYLPLPPVLSFPHYSVLTSITLFGSQDLAVQSYPNLFTHSLLFLNEVRMEQRRNARAEETGDHRENPLTSGIVRHDFHLRKSGVTRPGIEPGLPWWEASSLTAQSPRPHSFLFLLSYTPRLFPGFEPSATPLRYWSAALASNHGAVLVEPPRDLTRPSETSHFMTRATCSLRKDLRGE
ncbi:hypothetical protein PR048_031181 [Dryococelus australis]|uniref:Uncharacterized protein n=1 Tax=Dryococelus australis TaxID=614101 RepID=A0ABQ9G4J3_9NEOP|nr:hypothetical protein PR048_031181 [Dryococelus australis]